MLRPCLMTGGIFLLLCGVTLFFVDQFVIDAARLPGRGPTLSNAMLSMTPMRHRVIDPPDWAAGATLAVGTVSAVGGYWMPLKRRRRRRRSR